MTWVKHAWQFRIREMTCLKCQFISPNLRYLHSPLYFPFRNFHWGALKISQLISQSKKHKKTHPWPLYQNWVRYMGDLCPQFLGIRLKLFNYIWTMLKYASTVTRVSEFKWQTKGSLRTSVCAGKKTFADPIIKLCVFPLWLVSGSRQGDKAQAFPPHGTQGRGQRLGAKNCTGKTLSGWQTNSLGGGKLRQEVRWPQNAWMYEEEMRLLYLFLLIKAHRGNKGCTLGKLVYGGN